MSAQFPERLHTAAHWGDTTDPMLHNPANYRYLVHAINPEAKVSTAIQAIIDDQEGVVHEVTWGDQSINMYLEPERVAERVSLSMSLIDSAHTGTWGNAGLIIEAPAPNIAITSPSDAATRNSNLPLLLEKAQSCSKMSGDELLAETDRYNEVVALAHSDTGGDLTLKGFFYKTTSDGRPYDTVLYETVRDHAFRLGLPVVQIRQANVYKKDMVIRDDYGLAVHIGGSRYVLQAVTGSSFQAYDETFRSHFMSPGETKQAIGYMLQLGTVSSEEAESILAEYRKTDHARKTPKVTFSSDGDFVEATCVRGYGYDQEEVFIGSTGYCHRTNIQQIYQSIVGEMAGGSNSIRSYRDRDISIPLSLEEVGEYVVMACNELDKSQASLLRQWFAENKAKIEQRHQEWTSSLRGMAGYPLPEKVISNIKPYPF